MHYGFQNTHLRIAKMHMMINKNMIMYGASSLRHTLAILGPLQTQQLKETLISGQTEKHLLYLEELHRKGKRNLRGKTMGGSISRPRPSTQPKKYHELK